MIRFADKKADDRRSFDMRAQELSDEERLRAFLNEIELIKREPEPRKEGVPEILEGISKEIRAAGEILGRILVTMKGEATEIPFTGEPTCFMEALQIAEKQARALKLMAEELNEMF